MNKGIMNKLFGFIIFIFCMVFLWYAFPVFSDLFAQALADNPGLEYKGLWQLVFFLVFLIGIVGFAWFAFGSDWIRKIAEDDGF